MNKAQISALQTKIMAVSGMTLTGDAGFQVDESPARDLGRTHFRFTSEGGEADDQNGTTFTKFMRAKGVYVEQRRPKLVVIANDDLAKVFNV